MSNVIYYQNLLNQMIQYLSNNGDDSIDTPDRYYWRLNKLTQWNDVEIKQANQNGGSDIYEW